MKLEYRARRLANEMAKNVNNSQIPGVQCGVPHLILHGFDVEHKMKSWQSKT